MKTHTKYPVLVAAMGFVILGGCSKRKSGGDSTPITTTTNVGYVKTPTNINTVTATASCDYDVSDTAYTNHGWTKAFDDEFTDLSNWYAVTGGVKTELECNEPANAQIVNGALTITAKQESVTGPKLVGNDTTQSFSYTSAWLISNATFSANATTPKVRIVARLKTASGYGISSVFSAFGVGGSNDWPMNGEIDMMENQGYDPKTYAVDYLYGTTAGKSLVTDGLIFNPVTEDLSACYHVYVMEWTQNSLKTYIDGNLVETTNGTYVPNLFGKAMYLSLSAPIGGLYYRNLVTANVQGGTMSVDYVKVFTSN
jgi:beta-glucanase (GH16 family)